MKKFVLLLLFCHVSSSVKHSLTFFFTGFSGIPNYPDFIGTVEVDHIQAAYCDSNKKVKPKQHWVKNIMRTDKEQVDWYKAECFDIQPYFFKTTINVLRQAFSQGEGVHILQRISGCEWDDETGEVDSFMKFGYDGEDFISFDAKSLTWIAVKPEGLNTKLRWDADRARMKHYENYLSKVCPGWLKKYVDIGKSSLHRTDLPSVSLLQKSNSSQVTCFATGFYPDRVMLFWRKDGDRLFENVDHGEILPNHDGTLQMSVALNISSVTPEDWRRYQCVFQLSGVEDEILTQLDEANIKTNWGKFTFSKNEDHGRSLVTVGVGVVAVLIFVFLPIAAVGGYTVYRSMKATKTRKDQKKIGTLPQPDPEEEKVTLNTEPDG